MYQNREVFMPELPEVETVKETLKRIIISKKIIDVNVYCDNIVAYPSKEIFVKKLIGQTIKDIKRRGKWLLFELDDYYLLSHLRMEGKFNWKKTGKRSVHEHIIFVFADGQLRYQDTRKFGRMHLIKKDELYVNKPLSLLGLEPFDEKLTVDYLRQCYKNKKLPIKSVILDQSIIAGIGNIYADEILFLSGINPLLKACCLNDDLLDSILKNTRKVLSRAILKGGTTIRSYSSSEGVHGRFQQDLLVHTRAGQKCVICFRIIIKIKVNGRGTYYCPNCQKL